MPHPYVSHSHSQGDGDPNLQNHAGVRTKPENVHSIKTQRASNRPSPNRIAMRPQGFGSHSRSAMRKCTRPNSLEHTACILPLFYPHRYSKKLCKINGAMLRMQPHKSHAVRFSATSYIPQYHNPHENACHHSLQINSDSYIASRNRVNVQRKSVKTTRLTDCYIAQANIHIVQEKRNPQAHHKNGQQTCRERHN